MENEPQLVATLFENNDLLSAQLLEKQKANDERVDGLETDRDSGGENNLAALLEEELNRRRKAERKAALRHTIRTTRRKRAASTTIYRAKQSKLGKTRRNLERDLRTPGALLPERLDGTNTQTQFLEALSDLVTKTVDAALDKRMISFKNSCLGEKHEKDDVPKSTNRVDSRDKEEEEAYQGESTHITNKRVSGKHESTLDQTLVNTLKALEMKVQELQQKMDEPKHIESRRATPFADEVLKEKAPLQYQSLGIEYDGTTDPADHLNRFENIALVYGWSDAIMCRVFPTTLLKAAQTWYCQLLPQSIRNFGDFSGMFLRQFTSCRKYQKLPYELFNIQQRDNESLRAYVKRFNTAKLDVPSATEETLVNAMITGLKQDSFFQNIIIKAPRTFGELLARAENYINLEDALKIKEAADKNRGRRTRDDKQDDKKIKNDDTDHRFE